MRDPNNRNGSLIPKLVIGGVGILIIFTMLLIGFIGGMSNVADLDIPARDVAADQTAAVPTTGGLTYTTTSIPPRSTTTAAATTTTSTTSTTITTTTSALAPVGELEAGLFCRDLYALGYEYEAAVTYWTRESSPDRMDADRNGIPCETVYPAPSVLAFWGDPLPTTTQPPADTTTVAKVVNWIQAQIDKAYEPSEHTLGPDQLDCADSGSVRVGETLSCMIRSNHHPDYPLEDAGVMIYVLDIAGRSAWIAGTDSPRSTAELRAAYERIPKGLFCRDLLDPHSRLHPFDAAGRPATSGFLVSLMYWSLEGEPDRMDADHNGIPCETLYDADDVASVLAGGPNP